MEVLQRWYKREVDCYQMMFHRFILEIEALRARLGYPMIPAVWDRKDAIPLIKSIHEGLKVEGTSVVDSAIATAEQMMKSLGDLKANLQSEQILKALCGTSLNVLCGQYTRWNTLSGVKESAEQTAYRDEFTRNYVFHQMLKQPFMALQEVKPDVLGLLGDQVVDQAFRGKFGAGFVQRTFTGAYTDVQKEADGKETTKNYKKGDVKADGCAIIYSKAIFDEKHVQFKALYLPEMTDMKGITIHSDPRVAIMAILPLKDDPTKKIAVLCVHLHGPPNDHMVRQSQMRYAVQELEKFAPGIPYVITGDTNESNPDGIKAFDDFIKKVVNAVQVDTQYDCQLAAYAPAPSVALPLCTTLHSRLTYMWVSEPYAAQMQAQIVIPDRLVKSLHPNLELPSKALSVDDNDTIFALRCFATQWTSHSNCKIMSKGMESTNSDVKLKSLGITSNYRLIYHAGDQCFYVLPPDNSALGSVLYSSPYGHYPMGWFSDHFPLTLVPRKK
jgi:hypothetical protein